MTKGIVHLPSTTKRAKQIMQAKDSRTIQGDQPKHLTDKQLEQIEWNNQVELNKQLKKAQH